ncbi:MAG: FAD binding domain-containing protein, partial [Rhodospirillaceae bacterium]|nr:FAD binding domain-containing protein [Rhodospirillaceae bacterium]
MKPPRFDYVRASSTEEAIEMLTEHGDDARVLAGGQSLVAMLNMRLVAPEVIVDISRVPELGGIRCTKDTVEIGAAVTQAATERFDGLATHLPLVARALPFVGHYQTR